MLKSLFASCLCSLSVNTQAVNVSPSSEPSRAITEDINGKYEVTYKYESNVVESIDDVIEGHIYDYQVEGCSLDELLPNTDSYIVFTLLTALPFNGFLTLADSTPSISSFSSSNCYVFLESQGEYEINVYSSYSSYLDSDYMVSYIFDSYFLSDCVILIHDFGYLPSIYPYLVYTEYNEIESIREIRSHNNLYRLLYDFYYSLFSDDDLAEISTGYNMPFDNWLAHTCTIITLLVLVFVCFLFLKWLFKVISGLILLKH